MKKYLKVDPWQIIEDGFHPDFNEISESLFSLGNGKMGQRGNFEEKYSGKTLKGQYTAGVYYPDKTKVGWWKNGYPEYFAKVLNATNWIGVNIKVENEELDLNKCEVLEFSRVLDMKEGSLKRSFTAKLPSGKIVKVKCKRICSLVDDEVGAIKYAITPVNFDGKIRVESYLDADIVNRDANYDDKFWTTKEKSIKEGEGYILAETKKSGFLVATGMRVHYFLDKKEIEIEGQIVDKDHFVSNRISQKVKKDQKLTIYKYCGVTSSLSYAPKKVLKNCSEVTLQAFLKGFAAIESEQKKAWAEKWKESDILIEGDDSAQQGIRFNIFQLHQTYTGQDAHLNIGPKGFTGEKYGGSTYWDTEAFCLPFYLATAKEKVSRNLLVYRYNHLEKAIENAAKLGFDKGAALYPMVTMNGEECHNEWEITFEEIHRNGAIAYAIYDYVRYTGDKDYLAEYGLPVLVAIARFWAQRVNWSKDKKKYVILGVTGPNEYENNVNNNWYTNKMAEWCLNYAADSLAYVQEYHPDAYKSFKKSLEGSLKEEAKNWNSIANKMYFPYDEENEIFLQQDGFLDKELIKVKDLDDKHLPINQNWSWDRILRSCFIKQADTIQGLYCFYENYDEATIRRNFDFYEPMTVHESSLSPCVHSVIAARLNDMDRAYDLYMRTARLDLDDYNNDTEDGCHITSMAGSWTAIVKGFGGMEIKEEKPWFAPQVPKQWKGYAFKISFRGQLLKLETNLKKVMITNLSKKKLSLVLYGNPVEIDANETLEKSLQIN